MAAPIYNLTSSVWGVPFLHIFVVFLIIAIQSDRCEVVPLYFSSCPLKYCTSGPAKAPSLEIPGISGTGSTKQPVPEIPAPLKRFWGAVLEKVKVRVWFRCTVFHLTGSWLRLCFSTRLEKKGEVVFKSSLSLALASETQRQWNWNPWWWQQPRRACVYPGGTPEGVEHHLPRCTWNWP